MKKIKLFLKSKLFIFSLSTSSMVILLLSLVLLITKDFSFTKIVILCSAWVFFYITFYFILSTIKFLYDYRIVNIRTRFSIADKMIMKLGKKLSEDEKTPTKTKKTEEIKECEEVTTRYIEFPNGKRFYD